MSRRDLSALVCRACRHALTAHDFTNPHGECCWGEQASSASESDCSCPTYTPPKLYTAGQVAAMLEAGRVTVSGVAAPSVGAGSEARRPRVPDVAPKRPRNHGRTGRPRGRPPKTARQEVLV